jgi:hypothetical protein
MDVATLSPDTITVVTMLEHLPNAERKIVVEKVRDLIDEWEDEREWDEMLAGNPEPMLRMAEQAEKEIAEGKVSPMEI